MGGEDVVRHTVLGWEGGRVGEIKEEGEYLHGRTV